MVEVLDSVGGVVVLMGVVVIVVLGAVDVESEAVELEGVEFEAVLFVVEVAVGFAVDVVAVLVAADVRLAVVVVVVNDPFATGQPYPVFSWQHHFFFTSDHSVSQPLTASKQSNGAERSDWSAGHPIGGWLLQHQNFFASDHPTLHLAWPAAQSNGSVVELRHPSGG